MNKFSLTLFIILFAFKLSAQQVDWMISNPINYSLNPGMVYQTIATSPNGNVICSRLDSSRWVFDQNVFGRTLIECRDASSNVQWSFVLNDSIVVHHIITDSNNDIYVGGRFIGIMNLNNVDTLNNSSITQWNEDDFLIKLSSSGSLLWKKNVSVNAYYPRLTSLVCDRQNNFWFCTSNFMDSHVFKTNATGDVVDSLVITHCKGVSGISFDTFGALYICGATEMGTMEIGSSPVNVPESYMMYIARLNASTFSVDWTRLGHDVTFQSPELVSDGTGGVFFAGNLMDSVVWGNITINHPQWNGDFFLVRVDSAGNFLWGRSTPLTPTITGRYTIASPGRFLTTDLAGNAILLGTLNGSVDWGNGIMQSGTLGTEIIHLVAFDNSNNALWQKTGGGLSNFPTAISSSDAGEIYFTAAVTNTCTFDSISVNQGGTLANIVVKIIPSSVNVEWINNNSLALFPNPSINYVRVPVEWSGKLISIFNVDGRLVKSAKANGTVLMLDGITSGNYLVRCENVCVRINVIKE